MKKNFERCLDIVLHHEGGYVNHPRDPGGMTNMGITARTYEKFHKMRPGSVTQETMMELTYEDVAPIYKQNFWDVIQADELPGGVDLSMFDMAVNAGPSRATHLMQGLFPTLARDGIMGPVTRGEIWDEYYNYADELIFDYATERERYYKSLPTFDAFGRGWLRRVEEVEDESIRMIE